jgi:selenocysteine lyase/cysteine desulfurase
MEEFIRHQVYVSVRGDAIRVAPHVFNHERDIDALFAVLKKFLH